MGKTTNKLLAALFMAVAGSTAGAANAAQPFMQTGGLSTQPVGHYEFCQRAPQECQRLRETRPVELTRELWAKIIEINNVVNTMITPRTDYEIWGVEEHWSYPVNGIGDCEDYVLEKRRLLMKAGVPAANLLITVVRQPNGDGHAVLTVQTSMGDFILDNLEGRVLAWHDTDYRFLKRQSSKHAGMWVAIDDGRNVLVGSVGGKR
ncbi:MULTISPECIES: transglutaminase-like cysteine peptidase [unclassified Aminobacter]|uniref:transglutaminase-like cysteine peptidase n=1 Tax=unclassified Aminobacter TaxID=2644704 RepID=UPI000466DC25|nr:MULTISPECIES: transglutaminase-like cysteine peptidase [unclassified Aminobacter]TWG53612.1 putative transglutaminase-like cysteine proteinase [Aminobacter sp. J44]TWH23908.1 putative transglutaminase-like cysteine proteinase [Aminobacter sp. J15]